MIQDAMMQLPEVQGTAKQICDAMASNPLHTPYLDWAPFPSEKDLFRWQKAMFRELGEKPQVVFAFIAIYAQYQHLFDLRNIVFNLATMSSCAPGQTVYMCPLGNGGGDG